MHFLGTIISGGVGIYIHKDIFGGKCGNVRNKIIKDGVTFSDAKRIANALNSYFCEIGQE